MIGKEQDQAEHNGGWEGESHTWLYMWTQGKRNIHWRAILGLQKTSDCWSSLWEEYSLLFEHPIWGRRDSTASPISLISLVYNIHLTQEQSKPYWDLAAYCCYFGSTQTPPMTRTFLGMSSGFGKPSLDKHCWEKHHYYLHPCDL